MTFPRLVRQGLVVILVVGVMAAVAPNTAEAMTRPRITWKVSSLDHSNTYLKNQIASTSSRGKMTITASGDCSAVSNTVFTNGSGSCTVKVKVKATKKFKEVKSTRTFTLQVCATGGHCIVRDTGPGGGFVFYDAGSQQAWGRYLEAAPSDLPFTEKFGCSGTVASASDNSIGAGAANTAAIRAVCTDADSAAVIAGSSVVGGKSDWFVPSRDDLQILASFGSEVPGITTGGYWSSTEYPGDPSGFGYIVSMFNGSSGSYPKAGIALVRLVRAF